MYVADEFHPRGALAGVSLGAPATTGGIIWGLLGAASVGVSAYHGYKRNGGSVGWAIGWGLLGGAFPVLVPAVAFAQGIGKRK